jgi:hypothetical protein
MRNLLGWFAQAERFPVTDLWSEIESREPRPLPSPSPIRRIVAAGVAFALMAILAVVVIRSMDGTQERPGRPVGGDLELTMHPGNGREPTAGRGLGALVEPGTVTLVGWVETELGMVEVVSFKGRTQAGDPNSHCISVREPEGSSVSCGERRAAPFDRIGIHGSSLADDYASAGAFGGDEAYEAVFRTSSDRTVSVRTLRGLAYAIWPSAWGWATNVTFFDERGRQVLFEDFRERL